MKQLIEQALDLDKGAIGQLISLFEDVRPEAMGKRQKVIAYLKESSRSRQGFFVGITGAPGSGKSSLIGKLAVHLIKGSLDLRVAALAVDPSSEISGGAFLGDRTRVSFPVGENRLFFRSQSSECEVGGLGPHTFSVSRLLYYLFDCIFVETVGIGQNELEVQHLADWLYLVIQPLAGDQIQFMKAGIMEIPDAYIVNKIDQKGALKSYYGLKSSLGIARPHHKAGQEPAVIQASAQSGVGIDEICRGILTQLGGDSRKALSVKERYFLRQWVRGEFGRKVLKEFDLKEEEPSFQRLSFDQKKMLCADLFR